MRFVWSRSAISAALAAALVPAFAAGGAAAVVPVKPPLATATVEQCVTNATQAERSATFVGEMTAVPGTARMMMRIDVLERGPEEVLFHTIAYPGLGTWLRAAPGVKTYKNLDRVTDLSAPAAYRAAIRFRWLNSKGKLIKVLELRTPRCEQPLQPSSSSQASAGAAGAA
jgi:hypothetical protein